MPPTHRSVPPLPRSGDVHMSYPGGHPPPPPPAAPLYLLLTPMWAIGPTSSPVHGSKTCGGLRHSLTAVVTTPDPRLNLAAFARTSDTLDDEEQCRGHRDRGASGRARRRRGVLRRQGLSRRPRPHPPGHPQFSGGVLRRRTRLPRNLRLPHPTRGPVGTGPAPYPHRPTATAGAHQLRTVGPRRIQQCRGREGESAPSPDHRTCSPRARTAGAGGLWGVRADEPTARRILFTRTAAAAVPSPVPTEQSPTG
ncbi:hypothetical protein Rhow_000792 [Rhodococcus wratislaviensis]|uniref:Uncharacterized protein n=1 Tax=Rhodococcus wratislaviensis TaxID=44752 RepID=A0A402C2V1_RHOWR|nr:hypothetical protein Rhow_000792 [Rhodococcus wratislaviensis]